MLNIIHLHKNRKKKHTKYTSPRDAMIHNHNPHNTLQAINVRIGILKIQEHFYTDFRYREVIWL